MNNKGFAITSVIYGLAILGIMIVLILMGTLSSSRNNVKEEAERVEDFLLAINQTEVVYRESGVYTVPRGETGWYRIEVFGHKDMDHHNGANGAYATGIIYLDEGNRLKIDIGNSSNQINTTVSFIKSDDMLPVKIISAGRGIGNSPGGTVKKYLQTSSGGRINLETYHLDSSEDGNSFTGTNESYYSDGNDNTSYISGYPVFCKNNNCSNEYYFVDGLMLEGASSLSSGKVIIERLAEKNSTTPEMPRKNHDFDNINTIVVSSDAPIDAIYISFREALSSKNGHTAMRSCAGSIECTVNIHEPPSDGAYIDDINIVFNRSEKRVNKVSISFIDKNNRDHGITDGWAISNSPLGLHLSAYQPSGFSELKHGNFYIIPFTSENKVVSASSSAALDANGLSLEYLTGEARQKWSIDQINHPKGDITFPNIPNLSGNPEYRIMELARYKSMGLYYDENFERNHAVASLTFNSLSRNEPQIWNITNWGCGIYSIKSVVSPLYNDKNSGFLFGVTNVPTGESRDLVNDVIIGGGATTTTGYYANYVPTEVERFYLYSLDFSN